jgi:hypothetical protein
MQTEDILNILIVDTCLNNLAILFGGSDVSDSMKFSKGKRVEIDPEFHFELDCRVE